MQKLYFKILITFIVFIIFINLILAIATLNIRQLVNFAFYDTKITALIYRASNLIFESGLFPKEEMEVDLIEITDDAAEYYNIDKNLLYILISPDDKYQISLTGGLGYTKINPFYFFDTEYEDPFTLKDNIFAAAEVLADIQATGVHQRDIIREYLILGLNFQTIRQFSPSTNRQIQFYTEQYNKFLDSQIREEKEIDLFSTETTLY